MHLLGKPLCRIVLPIICDRSQIMSVLKPKKKTSKKFLLTFHFGAMEVRGKKN